MCKLHVWVWAYVHGRGCIVEAGYISQLASLCTTLCSLLSSTRLTLLLPA